MTDAATSKPVPDVVITATSPALQGEEVVVTDSSGLYRLAQLPAGVYTLKLEKESFKPYSRTDINVRTDRTVRVNIQLQPEAVQGDTVVVVGRSPTVDIGSTTTGINVGKDFINNISFIQPNGSGVRTFESLASVAPQVVNDEYGYGFSGAQSPENLYLVDGVSVGDPAYGVNGAQFPVEFVEEANVITGGYMAEYGRATGGVLNVVTKSGSNEFHGMVWGNWTPGALQGTRKIIDSDASAVRVQTKLLNTVDFGAQVGGPIIKDRLWFFVGFAPSFNWDQTTRDLRAFVTDPVTMAETNPIVPGSTQVRPETQRAFSYIAKLTFLLNADNNISLSVVGSPSTDLTPFSFNEKRASPNGRWKGGAITNTDSNTLSLRYQGGFLDKHLLLDASVGWFRLHTSTLPTDGSGFTATPGDGTAAGTPAVTYRRTRPRPITEFETLTPEGLAVCVDGPTCPATGGGAQYTIGGFGLLTDATLDRLQGRASATFLFQGLGHHIVKVGLDIEHLRYDIKKMISGGSVLRENTPSTRFDDYRQYGFFTAPDEATRQAVINSTPTSNSVGAYLQDSWSIMDVVTLNAGVRYDNQQLIAGDNTLGMTLNNMISPRIGVIYDFTQQGRSKLFANFSRYYEAVPMDIADRALTGENQYQFQHTRAASPGVRPGCDPLADIGQALNECLDPRNNRQVNRLNGGDYDPNGGGLQTGAGKTPVDANLKPQSSDEIVVGGEYEIISDGRVGVTYTRRYMNAVIEDMSVDEASTYFIGNPGLGISSAFPRAVRDYDAVTGYFNKAFSDGWMGQVSYTYSSLRGNYNGLFRPEDGQLDPNINADFDLISLLPNSTGPLDADRSHFVKAYASKEFQITPSFSLVAGITYEGRSGGPINYLGSHGLYGADSSFVLPRGAGGRLPWRHAFNAKGGVRYKISKDNVIEFTADVFNVFNFQAVTAVDNTITNSDALPFQTTAKDPQAAACLAGTGQPQCSTPAFDADGEPILNADGTQAYELPILGLGAPLTSADINPNFKRPTAYQAPISVRFGLRFTF